LSVSPEQELASKYRLVSQHIQYSFFLNKTIDRGSSLHACCIYRAHIIAIRLENS